MSMPKFNIRKFNPEVIEQRRLQGNPPTIVFIGKRSTGKSTLITDILWYIQKIPMFICMSGTEDGNGHYGKYMHKLLVHSEYKQDIVTSLITKQKGKLKKCIKDGIDPKNHPELGVGLLLDDLGYDDKIMRQKDVRLLFMNGRHWKICFMASLQYIMGLPPELRTNIDYLFCLRETNITNQKKMYSNFFGCFDKFEHFRQVFNACTNNYECLVLDNTSTSTNIEDCVFYYKATMNRKFRLGSKELWNYLDSRYDSDSDSDDDTHDKPKPSVIVNKTSMVEL